MSDTTTLPCGCVIDEYQTLISCGDPTHSPEAAMDEDAIRRESARIRSAYHPDGSPKSVHEYAGEVRGRAPQWQRLIDEARREKRRARLTEQEERHAD